jgi:nucleoside-diphosphate-sugar epimerase
MLDASSFILVTGGAGFIGGHITQRLNREGLRVRILDNFATGLRSTIAEVLAASKGLTELVEGDLRDVETVRRAMEGITHVVHQAALASVPRSIEDPRSSHEVNATGTLLLLDAARRAGVRRFLYAGSSSCYGDQPELPKRESMPTHPRSPYALSKLVGEIYGTLYHDLFGLSAVTLRYFNVFGPRQRPDSQYSAVIPLFMSAAVRGATPVVYGDGQQTRDFTFIDNVVQANWLALQAEDRLVGGKVFNVACGDRISLLRLLEIIGQLVGREIQPEFKPARAGDVRDSQAAIEEATRALGFRPGVDLEEGLAATLAWFRAGGPQ